MGLFCGCKNIGMRQDKMIDRLSELSVEFLNLRIEVRNLQTTLKQMQMPIHTICGFRCKEVFEFGDYCDKGEFKRYREEKKMKKTLAGDPCTRCSTECHSSSGYCRSCEIYIYRTDKDNLIDKSNFFMSSWTQGKILQLLDRVEILEMELKWRKDHKCKDENETTI